MRISIRLSWRSLNRIYLQSTSARTNLNLKIIHSWRQISKQDWRSKESQSLEDIVSILRNPITITCWFKICKTWIYRLTRTEAFCQVRGPLFAWTCLRHKKGKSIFIRKMNRQSRKLVPAKRLLLTPLDSKFGLENSNNQMNFK